MSNEESARAMSKLVDDSFDFMGISIINRREATYPIFSKYPPKNGDELTQRVWDMWKQQYREIQYAACDYLFKHKNLLTGQHLDFIKKLIRTRSWKDTVDPIATSILGYLVWKNPLAKERISSWIRDPNIWIRRSVIIFQLQYKSRTDWNLLKSMCLYCSKNENYYIRTGIENALLAYGRIRPSEVRHFIEENPFLQQTSQDVLKNI